MKIRVMQFGQHYIEYEGIISFDLDIDGYFMMDDEEGETVFIPRESIESVRVTKDEFDDNEVYVESV